MKLILLALLLVIGTIAEITYGKLLPRAVLDQNPTPGTLVETCPKDLSYLGTETEKILEAILSQEFKDTIRSSLKASIPEAIRQSDGLKAQIAFLKREIKEQSRRQTDAEQIARRHSEDSGKDLVPCPEGEEGSYCSAVEDYYISTALNMANRGFLKALECYQEQGDR